MNLWTRRKSFVLTETDSLMQELQSFLVAKKLNNIERAVVLGFMSKRNGEIKTFFQRRF